MRDNKLLNALRIRYEANKAEGEATLEVYLNNAVGIGEHPQMLDEMAKQIDKIAAADDALLVIRRIDGD